jgi:hypothetical protein
MPAPTYKYATVFDGQERNEGRVVKRTGKWGNRFRHRLLSAVRSLRRTALEDGVGGRRLEDYTMAAMIQFFG